MADARLLMPDELQQLRASAPFACLPGARPHVDMRRLLDHIAAMDEREAKLREALKPFAGRFTDYDGLDDDWPARHQCDFTIGDFRRLDEALAALEPAKEPR